MTDIKKQYINLLQDGKLKDCLQKLTDTLADGDTRNVLSSLRGQYNRLLNEKGKGVISFDEYRREENRIDEAVRSLVNTLKPIDISENIFAQTFLIICNPNKLDEMKAFFGKKYFPNAEFCNYGEPFPKGIYDIIVLEDENNIINQISKNKGTEMPTEENALRRKQMKVYLDASDAYFLYIGNRFTLGYEQKVYFANSRFSIYARLKELLDYKKYYGK